MKNDERATLTIAEAAEVLGIGRGLCYLAAQRGELPTLRVGRRWLISRAGLERIVNAGKATNGG